MPWLWFAALRSTWRREAMRPVGQCSSGCTVTALQPQDAPPKLFSCSPVLDVGVCNRTQEPWRGRTTGKQGNCMRGMLLLP
eukprot:4210495-Amphidinium_carterae.1